MVDVCSIVDLEMSPIRASAPVLKMPIAIPEIVKKNDKEQKDLTHCEKVRVEAKSTNLR